MNLTDAIQMIEREEACTVGPRREALRLVLHAAMRWRRHERGEQLKAADDLKDDHE